MEFPGYGNPKGEDIADAKALLKEAGYDAPSKLAKRVLTTTAVGRLSDRAQ